MFATVLGPLPRPPLPPDATLDALDAAVIEAQVATGLEPVIGWASADENDVADAWARTASLSDRAVKQVLLGPCSGIATGAATEAVARRLNEGIRALAAAGCPMIEIHEPAAAAIGPDPDAWSRFRDAHAALTDGVTDIHLSLVVTGGSIDPTGIETVLSLSYASLGLDLIAGPENWRLVRAAPGTLGIVAGALSTMAASDDGPETLLWAAAYAASGHGRGPDRVGLATAASLAHLPWGVAIRKLERLGDAARLAALPGAELRGALDPRSIDSRSAALGRVDPPPSRPTRKPSGGGSAKT